MKKLLLSLGLVAALAPAMASAAGGYVGVSAGNTKSDFSDIPGVEVDNKDTGNKLFAGYRPHENFALEVFRADLGETTATSMIDSADLEIDTFGVAGVGILPVAQNCELFVKAGLHRWDADLRDSNGFSGEGDGTDLMFGFGTAYNFDPITVRAEFESYDIDDVDVEMFSLGVVFNF